MKCYDLPGNMFLKKQMVETPKRTRLRTVVRDWDMVSFLVLVVSGVAGLLIDCFMIELDKE